MFDPSWDSQMCKINKVWQKEDSKTMPVIYDTPDEFDDDDEYDDDEEYEKEDEAYDALMDKKWEELDELEDDEEDYEDDEEDED
jgi:hypothetical protein